MDSVEDIKAALDGVGNIKWDIHPSVGMSFISIEEIAIQENNLSILRRNKALTEQEYDLIKFLLVLGDKNRYEMLALVRNQPRRDAQAFIAKKNIRAWLFKRDGYRCLRCGNVNSLSVDHIVSVNKGGMNRLGNLQTLCGSCNSWKSDRYEDFR